MSELLVLRRRGMMNILTRVRPVAFLIKYGMGSLLGIAGLVITAFSVNPLFCHKLVLYAVTFALGLILIFVGGANIGWRAATLNAISVTTVPAATPLEE